jgi:uncharacterized membrane protein
MNNRTEVKLKTPKYLDFRNLFSVTCYTILNTKKVILPILLTGQTIYSWTFFYKAQFLEYDDNYGMLIHGFIISSVTLLILIIIWFRKRQWIKDTAEASIIWLCASSPVTLAIAAIYYQNIFGLTLAN